MKKFLAKINIARHVCSCLAGKKHHFRLRAFVGIMVMVVGAIIMKMIGHNDHLGIAITGDIVGLGLHGVGLIPFVEFILELEE